MSRSRCLLHRTRLKAFQAFCEERGWVAEPTKGIYEVLRMRHPEEIAPMIVYRRIEIKEHLTVYGTGVKLAIEFVHQKRRVT